MAEEEKGVGEWVLWAVFQACIVVYGVLGVRHQIEKMPMDAMGELSVLLWVMIGLARFSISGRLFWRRPFPECFGAWYTQVGGVQLYCCSGLGPGVPRFPNHHLGWIPPCSDSTDGVPPACEDDLSRTEDQGKSLATFLLRFIWGGLCFKIAGVWGDGMASPKRTSVASVDGKWILVIIELCRSLHSSGLP